MGKFKNKYRITSHRAPFWDYAWNAAYFVTICTKNRKHHLKIFPITSPTIQKIGTIAQSILGNLTINRHKQ